MNLQNQNEVNLWIAVVAAYVSKVGVVRPKNVRSEDGGAAFYADQAVEEFRNRFKNEESRTRGY